MKINRMKYTIEFYQECNDYLNLGHSLKETALNFNINYHTLKSNLIKLGLRKPSKKYSIIYKYQEDYFDEINSHKKAYFLGLLLSDGYICKNAYGWILGIALQLEDKYILEEFKKEINTNSKISIYKNSCKLTISISEHTLNSLYKLGMCEDKSHSNYFVPPIEKEFINSFVRGYFDGDGCISIKATKYISISICSNSLAFIGDLLNILMSQFNIYSRINTETSNRKNNLYILYITRKEEQIKFKNFLYKNTNYIKLLRKYDKF